MRHFYLITRSNGFRKFYENAQKKNGLERSFLDNWILNFLFNNYFYYKKNKDKKGISSVYRDYLTDKYCLDKSDDDLEGIRGLILNLLEKEIARSDIKTILEIGTSRPYKKKNLKQITNPISINIFRSYE